MPDSNTFYGENNATKVEGVLGMVKEGLPEKVTSEQRPEADEETSPEDICRRFLPDKIARAKVLRQDCSSAAFLLVAENQ